MTSLSQFDTLGDELCDEATERVVRKGDTHRNLVRYRPDAREFFVSVRVNMPLWRVATGLPVVLVKPQSRADEIMRIDDLLTPEGSTRNYALREAIAHAVEASTVSACRLADQHGDRRRDFYFATDDADGFERLARAASDACAYPLAIERYRLADVASIILPTEAIGDLGIALPAGDRIRVTRFEFWGAEPSLARLRRELERRAYRFLSFESHLGELRMIKGVPIDGAGFGAVLRDIASLARSLGCSYRGTETVDGFEQFRLSKPLPERYAADSVPAGSIIRRLFGQRG